MWGLHRYEEAENYEVNKWLIESLKLTPYQQDILRTEEIVRFSKFTFLKRRVHNKPNLLWRLSAIPFCLFYMLLFIFLPFTYIFTGELGYSMKFHDKYVSKWRNKIGY